jgi:hypothetical protein
VLAMQLRCVCVGGVTGRGQGHLLRDRRPEPGLLARDLHRDRARCQIIWQGTRRRRRRRHSPPRALPMSTVCMARALAVTERAAAAAAVAPTSASSQVATPTLSRAARAPSPVPGTGWRHSAASASTAAACCSGCTTPTLPAPAMSRPCASWRRGCSTWRGASAETGRARCTWVRAGCCGCGSCCPLRARPPHPHQTVVRVDWDSAAQRLCLWRNC